MFLMEIVGLKLKLDYYLLEALYGSGSLALIPPAGKH